MSVFAQEEQIYLTGQNQLSKQKAEFKCVKNESKSKEYSLCYDCINASGKIAKELNMNLFVMKSLQNEQNKTYVKLAENNTHYLIGELKDGKPWNGFFKQSGGVLELKIFSFYKEGKQINQIYRNAFKDLLKDKEPGPYAVLEDQNTYKNDKLESGMEIIPDQNNDRSMDAVRFVKNGKTDHIILSMFAAYYAELIKFSNLENGYLLESIGKSSLKIIFTEKGRDFEFFDENKKSILTLGFAQYPFSSFNQLDKTLPISYFEKNGALFIEQMISRPEEASNFGDKNTKMILQLAQALPIRIPLDDIFPVSLLVNSGNPNSGGPLGYCVKDGASIYGFIYTRGEKPGAYNVDYYEDGKLSVKHPLKIRNKTLKEIALILKDRK